MIAKLQEPPEVREQYIRALFFHVNGRFSADGRLTHIFPLDARHAVTLTMAWSRAKSSWAPGASPRWSASALLFKEVVRNGLSTPVDNPVDCTRESISVRETSPIGTGPEPSSYRA